MTTKYKVISGFPGIGKSTLFRDPDGLVIKDSDSSTFDKSEFPNNYLDHIESCITDKNIDYVLVSSHKDVRDGMNGREIDFLLVYPDKNLKEEYLQRYRDRNSPQSFIDLLDNNWNDWIDQCNVESGPKLILGKGEYLSNYTNIFKN